MNTKNQTCGNCRYYDAIPDFAECFANPPTVGTTSEGFYRHSWRPQVAADDTACRFFEQKGEVL